MMKQHYLIFLLLFLCLGCDLFSGDDEETNLSEFVIEPQVLVENLSDDLKETSGLILFDDKMWSLNDGGGKNELYAINLQGDITQTVELSSATNTDWECLAHDENFIYIGDVGNNRGDRTDLRVYKVSKGNISTDEDFIRIPSDVIKFSYADQIDFTTREYQHEFDCEAMFSFGDQLYLFSKDWKKMRTTVYRLPKENGEYTLEAVTEYNTNGLITGADISSDGNYFALLGYSIAGINDLIPFIRIFKFDEEQVFSTKSLYFSMISIRGSQTEGIIFLEDGSLVFSTEKTDSYSQKIFSFDWTSYKNHLN